MPDCDKAPRVTVVTPAYNAGAYLAETLTWAQAQTVADFELLVVDDGSTDETAVIARNFAARDARIRLLQQPNAGTAAARNTALREGRGEFYALLDSDDLWLPDFLRDQLSILSDRPDIDIVSANAINLGGALDGQPLRPPSQRFSLLSLLEIIEIEDSVCVLSVFRRGVVERIGGFDVGARRNEDYDFWLRAACAGCRIAFNSRPGGYYRRRADSVSANETLMLIGITRVLDKIRRLCTGRAAELAAIERKIRRYDRRRLMLDAKTALLTRDFERAADYLQQARDRHGDRWSGLIAHLARRAPELLVRLYLARSGWSTLSRRLRLRRSIALRA